MNLNEKNEGNEAFCEYDFSFNFPITYNILALLYKNQVNKKTQL